MSYISGFTEAKRVFKRTGNKIRGVSTYLNPFGSKPTINSAGYGDNEITLMIKDELDREFKEKQRKNTGIHRINENQRDITGIHRINNKKNYTMSNNKDYRELLEKINNIYNNLHLDKNINTNTNINIKKTKEELIQLFSEDDKLNKMFVRDSAPFSDYNFFYGLDITSLQDKEIIETSMWSAKLVIVIGLVKFAPALSAMLMGPQGGFVAVALFAILYIKYTLEMLRNLKGRYLQDYKVKFCTKYMPFDAMSGFRSRLYEKYHKLFIYKQFNNLNNKNSRRKNTDIFLKFIIEKDDNEKKNFEIKVLNYLYYINKFIQDIIKENAVSYDKIKKTEQIKEIEENIKDVILKNDKNTNQNPNQNPNPNPNPNLGVPQSGGFQEESLRSLDNDTNKYYIKLDPSFSFRYTNFNLMNYRLNYKIDDTLILTSGDINIFMLNNEFYDILNTRTTYIKQELRFVSVSIPFFDNYCLLHELKDLYKLKTAESIKIGIIQFIIHYIESFLYLYLISEYNIKTLINNGLDSTTLLDKLFEANLKETSLQSVMGKLAGKKARYNFREGLLLRAMDNSRIKKIEKRDKINYFSILMKYSYLALDHIFKRLKLVIKENNSIKKNEVKRIDSNNIKDVVDIFTFNNYCEKAIFYNIDYGDYYMTNEEEKQINEKEKKEYYQDIKYNNKTYRQGKIMNEKKSSTRID